MNEVYKSYNVLQAPLCVLDFRLAPESVDINVSPDKRTIFVHSERNLIAALRDALDEFFAPTRSSFAVGGASRTMKAVASQKPDMAAEESEGEGGTGGESEEEAEAENREEEEVLVNGPESDVSDEEPAVQEQEVRLFRKRPVQGTLDTTVASWSPQKRPKTSLRSRLQSYSLMGTPAPAAEQEMESEAEELDEEEGANGDRETTGVKEIPLEDSEERPSRSSRRANEAQGLPLRRGPHLLGPVRRDETNARVMSVKLLPSQQEQRRLEYEEDEGDEDRDVAAKESPPQLPGQARQILEDREVSEEPPESETPVKISESQIPRPRFQPDTDVFETEGPEPPQPEQLARTPPTADDEVEVSVQTSRVQTLQARGDLNAEVDTEAEGEVRHGHSSQEVDDLCCGGHSPDDELEAGQAEPAVREAVHVDLNEDVAPRGYRDEITSTLPTSEVTLRFDLDHVKRRWASLPSPTALKPSLAAKLAKGQTTSAAGVGNKDDQAAAAALSRSISKSDFARMQILGQFNRGFIITMLGEDLYIVDQHASDEKYNFETLQATHRIQSQRLFAPKVLEMSVGDELTLIENLDTMERNGFVLSVDESEDARPGRRVKLEAMPVSKETVFDEADLGELIHLINEGAMPRSSKARAMFAMRACRRSVMIGTALNKTRMEGLIRHMGEIDQPWNCPHGRPTMRHLSTVERRDESGRGRIDWSRVKL